MRHLLKNSKVRAFISQSFFSSIVKASGSILSLVLSILIGRLIGAEGLGVLNLANKIIQILLVLSLFGMQQVIIKEVAIAFQKNKKRKINNVIYTSLAINFLVAIVIILLIFILDKYIIANIYKENLVTTVLLIMSLSFVPQLISRVFSSSLIGIDKVWQSNLVDQSLSILITLILVFFSDLLLIKVDLIHIAYCFVIGRCIVTLVVSLYWFIVNNFFLLFEKFEFRRMIPTAFPILIVNISYLLFLNTDVLMLGWFVSNYELGIYTVAAQIALMTTFFLQVTNSVISPKIAALYNSGKIQELEKMYQVTSMVLFSIGLIVILGIIFFGDKIISLWGKDFLGGYKVLIILGIGQLVNLSTGAVGLMLVLTGFEKTHSKISIVFLIINLMLNVILINLFGFIGAAVATASAVILENITKVILVKKRLNVSLIRRIGNRL